MIDSRGRLKGEGRPHFLQTMILSERQEKIIAGKICPYCGNSSVFVDSAEIYGKSFGMIYLCRPCDSYVGVHKGTDQALGRLANRELREWKKRAHHVFDLVWKSGKMKRGEAYSWLSEQLGIPKKYTHIGMFSVETCKKVVDLINKQNSPAGTGPL